MKDTLTQFEEYIKALQESAGSACQDSEGTMGCDEANFCLEVLREIDLFRNKIMPKRQ